MHIKNILSPETSKLLNSSLIQNYNLTKSKPIPDVREIEYKIKYKVIIKISNRMFINYIYSFLYSQHY